MSEDIVVRLRAEEWATAEREKTRNEAASIIEALRGEVASLRSTRDMHHANYELMKAHNKELFGKLSAAEAEAARLKGALIGSAASLAAAISLLERGGKAAKKAAPSDKMFAQMLVDYNSALEAARKALAGETT